MCQYVTRIADPSTNTWIHYIIITHNACIVVPITPLFVPMI